MTKYSTGNTVGSPDPRDLYDNAQNLDEFANSTTKETHPDRLGVPRKTLHGMQTEFNQLSHQAEDARDAAQLAETGAQTAQGLAEDAAEKAEGAANTYSATGPGLLATTSGEYFTVPSTKAGGYLDLYKNESGVAVLQRTSANNDIEQAANTALANANFVGRWEDQVGALAIPASVYHKGKYWILLDALADVTAAEPGESGSWDYLYDGNPLAFGPGPQTLIAGDMTAGFFGEVSADELFRGDELALMVGVTEGTAQNSTAGWLKFAHNNKIKYIAKQAFRHSISWDHLYSRGIVYGTDDSGVAPRGTATNQLTTVDKDGSQFAVRLLTGGNADPVDVSDSRFFTDDMAQLDSGGGSEWNRLMYRTHQAVPTDDGTDGMRQDRHGGPQAGGNWASYTNADLGIDGNGRAGWCQETATDSSAYRVFRGYDDVAHFYRYTASGPNSSFGWRPALELITNH